MGRVREMANIDKPHSNADDGDDLRKGGGGHICHVTNESMSCDRREHMY